MDLLSEEKKKKAILLLDEFIESGELVRRKDQFLKREEFQAIRKKVAAEIKILINDFLNGRINLNTFKKEVDGMNKRNPLWGFRGMKGQMFFNQLVNTCEDKKTLAIEIKKSISIPKNLGDAESKINSFTEFINKIGINLKNRRRVPRISSVPYFLSYFWQIVAPDDYPIYYSSTEQVFKELGFMPSDLEYPGDNYIYFYNLNNELRKLFKEHTGRDFSYWDVEHVFWYYHVQKTPLILKEKTAEITEDDYVPPTIKEIPLLACADETVVKKYDREEKKVEDVLEEKLYKLFLMLGYETDRLGRGRGRVPDGIARARQEGYAIIYDAKSRAGGRHSIGTDSRAIKEYIEEYSNVLHKEGLRNVYFVIISSDFQDNQEDEIRHIKMETGVQEVLLLKANLSLFILELKLKDPSIDLGKYGLQQVFAYSGVISKEEIQEYLAGR